LISSRPMISALPVYSSSAMRTPCVGRLDNDHYRRAAGGREGCGL
jgi:hypothetical protein